MRVLGKPSHISSQKHIIVRSKFSPSIGSRVLDESNSIVGEIIDVFGPVETPFVSIKPVKGASPSEIIKKTLFIKDQFSKTFFKSKGVAKHVGK